MFSNKPLWLLTLTLLMTTSHVQAFQKNKSEEQREAERIRNAEKSLQSAKKAFQTEEQDFKKALTAANQAEAKVQKLFKNIRKTKDSTEEKLEDSLGISEAKQKYHDSEATFHKVAQPLRDQFAATDEFKKAEKEAHDAKLELDELRENLLLSEEERNHEIDARVKLLHVHEHLQEEFVLNDPKAKELHYQMQELQKALAAIRSKIDEKLENHPDVKKTTEEWKAAKKELAELEKKLASARQSAEKAQSKVASAQQSVNAAKQADKKDDMNDRKRKKNK